MDQLTLWLSLLVGVPAMLGTAIAAIWLIRDTHRASAASLEEIKRSEARIAKIAADALRQSRS